MSFVTINRFIGKNIGSFVVKSKKWVKLEDVIKNNIPNFEFYPDCTYLLQANDDICVCIYDSLPNENHKGFRLKNWEHLYFEHKDNGDLGTLTAYVKILSRTARVNIAPCS